MLHSLPTQAYRKDEQIIGSNGRMRIARTGSWRLHATDSKPQDLNAQIAEILGRLTPDLHIWAHLSSRYRLDLFCGLFLNSSNEGLCLSPQSLRALGERGIELGLDIYSGAND